MALDAGHQERRAPKSSGRMSMSNGPLEIAGGQTFLLRKNKCHLAARAFILHVLFFLFWPDTLVVIGQFVIGASLLVVRPWCQNTVQVKRQGLLLTDMQRYSRERERIDLSGCTCMESESRTLEESWSPYAILFTSNFFDLFCISWLYLPDDCHGLVGLDRQTSRKNCIFWEFLIGGVVCTHGRLIGFA